MSSPNHTLASPDISDIISLLSTMKKQNEEILAKNEEILTKLNSIEDDNQKLRQELHEIKNYQKHNHDIKLLSRKRDDPEDEAEHQNEHSNNKKARVSVSVASLPEHEPEPESELVHILEPPASFDLLDDDCLGNVLEFVGKKCYSVFGRVNKRCHEMFCSKGLPKETYLYGYGPFHLIQQKEETVERWDYCEGLSNEVLHYNRRDIIDWMFTDDSDEGWDYLKGLSKGVLNYNRRDIFEWILTDESNLGHDRLLCLCEDAIIESRLDILREVFQRANTLQLEYLKKCDKDSDLCWTAAGHGKLECLRFLRENECGWNKETWMRAKWNGNEHILEYMRNNGFPTVWQN